MALCSKCESVNAVWQVSSGEVSAHEDEDQKAGRRWTIDETQLLARLVDEHGTNWTKISEGFRGEALRCECFSIYEPHQHVRPTQHHTLGRNVDRHSVRSRQLVPSMKPCNHKRHRLKTLASTCTSGTSCQMLLLRTEFHSHGLPLCRAANREAVSRAVSKPWQVRVAFATDTAQMPWTRLFEATTPCCAEETEKGR